MQMEVEETQESSLGLILVCLRTSPYVFYLLEIVATNATARGLCGKAVMNMSIGGSKSTALNAAIAALTRGGVTAVVAAGNDNVSQ